MKAANQLLSSLSPERRLLLLAARLNLSEDESAELKLLVEKIEDWECLLNLASRHGLTLLLSRHLNNLCGERVPASAKEHFRNHLQSNARRNLFLTRELIKLLRLFEANGVCAVPFKGPVLAATAYGNVALREFCDLDILVSRRDVQKAKEILSSQSYFIPYKFTPEQTKVYLNSNCSYVFEREDKRCAVDLHWRLSSGTFPFQITIEQLKDRLEQIELSGAFVKAFKMEDTILILCSHAAKHLHERLEWLASIAEIIRKDRSVDWEEVTSQARKFHCERMLLFSLSLTHTLFGVPIPEQLRQSIEANPDIEAYTRRIVSQLFSKQAVPYSLSEKYRLRFMLMDRRRDRVKYILKNLVVPKVPDIVPVSLPALFSPLYYATRQLRIFRKHWATIAKRVP